MDDVITRYWSKFTKKTVNYSTSVRARRWYTKRVEFFIKWFPVTRLQLISNGDLTDHLKGTGRKPVRQNWQEWMDRSHELLITHGTIAHIPNTGDAAAPPSGNDCIEWCRQQFSNLIERIFEINYI